MPEKSIDMIALLVAAAQRKKFEVVRASISDMIHATIRVPRALLNTRVAHAQQALDIAREMGWRLAGFNTTADEMFIDVTHGL